MKKLISLICASLIILVSAGCTSTNSSYANKYNASQQSSYDNCPSITKGHKNDNTGKVVITNCN